MCYKKFQAGILCLTICCLFKNRNCCYRLETQRVFLCKCIQSCFCAWLSVYWAVLVLHSGLLKHFFFKNYL